MHGLKKILLLIGTLIVIAAFAYLIYFLPVLAVLFFLGSLVVIWWIRWKQGERKRAWVELLKSLFLDW